MVTLRLCHIQLPTLAFEKKFNPENQNTCTDAFFYMLGQRRAEVFPSLPILCIAFFIFYLKSLRLRVSLVKLNGELKQGQSSYIDELPVCLPGKPGGT